MNAIVPYDDSILDYLNHLTSLEKAKRSTGGNSETLTYLPNMQTIYKEKIRVLAEAMENPNTHLKQISPFEINQLIRSLYNLNVMVKQLFDVMQVVESSGQRSDNYCENVKFRPKEKELSHYQIPAILQTFFGFLRSGYEKFTGTSTRRPKWC